MIALLALAGGIYLRSFTSEPVSSLVSSNGDSAKINNSNYNPLSGLSEEMFQYGNPVANDSVTFLSPLPGEEWQIGDKQKVARWQPGFKVSDLERVEAYLVSRDGTRYQILEARFENPTPDLLFNDLEVFPSESFSSSLRDGEYKIQIFYQLAHADRVPMFFIESDWFHLIATESN